MLLSLVLLFPEPAAVATEGLISVGRNPVHNRKLSRCRPNIMPDTVVISKTAVLGNELAGDTKRQSRSPDAP
jgi:hypothetical protein